MQRGRRQGISSRPAAARHVHRTVIGAGVGLLRELQEILRVYSEVKVSMAVEKLNAPISVRWHE